MNKHMFWALSGGLVLLVLAGVIVTQRPGQPPVLDTASAIAEATAAPLETPGMAAYGFDEIATYHNEEFGFTVQYPKTVPWRCQFSVGDDEICKIDMAPRDLSSVGVRDSVVLYLRSHELEFAASIEEKLPDFTSLLDLVQYRNEHINDVVPAPPILIKNVRQFTWQGYSAIATDDEFEGRHGCSLHVEKDDHIYMILFKYPCHLLTASTTSDVAEYDLTERQKQKMMAVKMVLDQFRL